MHRRIGPVPSAAAKVHYTFHSPNQAADATAASVTETHRARRQVPWGARSSRQGNPARLRPHLRIAAVAYDDCQWLHNTAARSMLACPPARASVRPNHRIRIHTHARTLRAHSGIP